MRASASEFVWFSVFSVLSLLDLASRGADGPSSCGIEVPLLLECLVDVLDGC